MNNQMIKEIREPSTKETIARHILNDLEEWFGMPEYTKEYIENSKFLPFFAAYDNDKAIGFIVSKETSKYTAEIYCMGVLKDYHRKGIGRELFQAFESYAIEKDYKFLQVKTVEEGKYDSYDLTNAFYRSCGFYPLEVFPKMWDEWNPCQILVKSTDRRNH
jgi:ribosomal protein S18 acetylase RimI-like enzyme